MNNDKFLDVVRWLFEANPEELIAVKATLAAMHTRSPMRYPQLIQDARKPPEAEGTGHKPVFVYEPHAPWAKKMWSLLLTARTSGLKYSPEDLAKRVGSTPKLVGMALLNLTKRPNCPLVREKHERTYFYWMGKITSPEQTRIWVKP